MEAQQITIGATTYFCTRVIGRGSFGHVVLATVGLTAPEEAAGAAPLKHVVLKLVDPSADPESDAAVRAEAAALAVIGSVPAATPGKRFVVAATGAAGVWRRFSVQPLIYGGGGDLMGMMVRRGGEPFEIEDARFYLAELVSALIFLHRTGVWVRDVSLTNTLLSSTGHVLLCDFGSSSLAANGPVVGVCCAPEFAAPEVASSEGGYDGGGADWWALGVVGFELFFGTPPWWKRDASELLNLLATGPKLVFFDADVPQSAKALCSTLLDPSPSRRLQSCEGDALKQHTFFEIIDWDMLEAGECAPPLSPTQSEIQTASRHPSDYTWRDLWH